MNVFARSASESRGTERLLRDCAFVGRLVDADRPPARQRLELELGDRFARLLLIGLRRRTTGNNGR
jgi:hypothetical protein